MYWHNIQDLVWLCCVVAAVRCRDNRPRFKIASPSASSHFLGTVIPLQEWVCSHTVIKTDSKIPAAANYILLLSYCGYKHHHDHHLVTKQSPYIIANQNQTLIWMQQVRHLARPRKQCGNGMAGSKEDSGSSHRWTKQTDFNPVCWEKAEKSEQKQKDNPSDKTDRAGTRLNQG